VEQGIAEQVLEHPSDGYTRTLLADLPRIERDASSAAASDA
jgi:ABC-type dipeptide/oligopeptide/nickel transport system ATPase component